MLNEMEQQSVAGSAFIHSLKTELKTATSVLNNLGLIPGKSMLWHNFQTYGSQLGAIDFNDFENIACVFFERAYQNSDNPDYSIVRFFDGRIGIDYKGELRGIYSIKHRPLAFFRPDFKQLGYSSKDRELADWRKGKSVFYA